MVEKITLKLPLPQSDKTPFWSPVATIFLTLAAFLGSQIVVSALIFTAPLVFGWSGDDIETWTKGVVGQFIFILLIEATVLVVIRGFLRIKKSSFQDIGLAWPRAKDIGYAIVGFGIYFLLYVVITAIAQYVFPELDYKQEQRIGFQSAHSFWHLLLVFVGLVVLPPIVEEILARGFLYTGLKTKLPVKLAAVITSLMFAAAHLQFGSGASLLWVAAIDTFILSLVLVYLREKTGNLGASIALHMLKNGLAFVLLFIIRVR